MKSITIEEFMRILPEAYRKWKKPLLFPMLPAKRR